MIHRVKTYWIRDYRGAASGQYFALCWTCWTKTRRYNNKKKALKNVRHKK